VVFWAALEIFGSLHPVLLTFLGAEAAVWVIEATLLKALSHGRWARRALTWIEALAISLAANGLSAGAGLLL